jgi:hypothetical protein
VKDVAGEAAQLAGSCRGAAGIGLLRPQPAGNLLVTVGKSLSIDSPVAIKRVSTANDSLVDTIAIGPKEVQINGKALPKSGVALESPRFPRKSRPSRRQAGPSSGGAACVIRRGRCNRASNPLTLRT